MRCACLSVAPRAGALGRAGIEAKLGEGLAVGVNFHLADTKAQAIKEATPFYEEHIKMFAPIGFFRGLSDEQLDAVAQRGGWAAAGIPALDEACENRSWYCGPPQGFIEYLHALGDAAPGLEMVNVQASMATPQQVIIEQLQWSASAVMPEFQPAGAAIR